MCAPCIAAQAALNASRRAAVQRSSDSNYNLPQLQIWKSKLNCIKLQNKYANYNTTPTIINSYIGIVDSAIRNPNNIGYFEPELVKISSFITFVISQNDC